MMMMLSCSGQDEGRAAATATEIIAAVHPDIIQAHVLTRLDGATLASASCASSSLNKLCNEDKLWRDLCNSRWPSTTDPLLRDVISCCHRSFFSDASSAVDIHRYDYNSDENMPRLMSAVDIRFEENLICSRVTDMNTSTTWFRSSPFRIDLLEPKEMVPTAVKFAGDDEPTCMETILQKMELSWILIDPSTKRALNVSSGTPVEVRRNWMTGEVQARFSTVMRKGGDDDDDDDDDELVQSAVWVTCRGNEGGEFTLQVREVSMQVEDTKGRVLNGEESLVILQGGMRSGRRRMKKKGEDQLRYDLLLELKRVVKERSQRREKGLDLMCVASGIIIFLGFCAFIYSL